MLHKIKLKEDRTWMPLIQLWGTPYSENGDTSLFRFLIVTGKKLKNLRTIRNKKQGNAEKLS
jgi:hypothetical protein